MLSGPLTLFSIIIMTSHDITHETTPFFSDRVVYGTDDIVAGGSDIQVINFVGIGRKQISHSSFGGGSLNSASSRSSAARCLHIFLCFDQ